MRSSLEQPRRKRRRCVLVGQESARRRRIGRTLPRCARAKGREAVFHRRRVARGTASSTARPGPRGATRSRPVDAVHRPPRCAESTSRSRRRLSNYELRRAPSSRLGSDRRLASSVGSAPCLVGNAADGPGRSIAALRRSRRRAKGSARSPDAGAAAVVAARRRILSMRRERTTSPSLARSGAFAYGSCGPRA